MNKFIIFCFSLFLIVSCQKDVNEDISEVNTIDSRSSLVDNEATTAGDIIRDHFHNNKSNDPLILLPKESREEFIKRLTNITDDFSEDLKFTTLLEKLRNEYGMSKNVSIELELFQMGLINAIEKDAHTVFNYYNIELLKNRKLSPLESYQVTTIVEASQALWDVTCTHLGIANEFQVITREERDPLCEELIDDLKIKLTQAIGFAASGYIIGKFIGLAGGAAGSAIGGVIGSVAGGVVGWFRGSDEVNRLFDECEECVPPTSIDVMTADCSLTADFTPVGAGSMVISLLWESDQTIPSSAIGSGTQRQTFKHKPGSGPIQFRMTATCMLDGETITLSRIVSGGNIESQIGNVPYNAFYVVGNDAVKVPIINGQVGEPVTETYLYRGLALDNPDDYSYEFLGNVVNGSIVSSTSSSIRITWYPSNIDEYLLSEYVWGSLRYKVTNNCPGGESKIFTFNAFINGSENEI